MARPVPQVAVPAQSGAGFEQAGDGAPVSYGSPVPAGGAADFKVSVGYPKRVAKGRASTFLVQIQVPANDAAAAQRLLEAFGETPSGRASTGQQLPLGRDVTLALASADIEFSPPKQWSVSPAGIDAAFWGRPLEQAQPGAHAGILTISETSSQRELASMPFTVSVADFALGKVSRPALRTVVSGLVVVGSLAVLGYSFMNQVQEVMGVVTGAVGAAISAVVTVKTTTLYSRRSAGATTTVPMS